MASAGYRGAGSAGWATIGGVRCYYRSKWERNYARYLQLLTRTGKIAGWQHEPKTFWFDSIKRGVRSYKPDFRVDVTKDESVWHEVKGFLDSKSATKIKRFKKYYPDEQIIVIDADWFKRNARLKKVIIGWE